MNTQPGLRYDFGSFRLEPGRHLLLLHGEPAHLKPKVFDLLVFLVENRGRLVTKRELMDELWRDQFVEDSNLSQSVYELRRVLGAEPGGSSYVETVPRRGYRFVAEIRVAGEEAHGERRDQQTREQVADEPPATAPSGTAEPLRYGATRRWRWAAVLTAVIAAGVTVWNGILDRSETAETARRAQRLDELRSLSNVPGNHQHADFSPDGRWLAFVNDASGTPQIWVRSLAGGEPLQVTRDVRAAARPRWTIRDEIVFAREGEGIWAVPALGGGSRQITPAGFNPDVSSDGRLMVYEQEGWLWTVPAGGGSPRQLVPLGGVPFIWAMPAFSPDGRWVAYFRTEVGPAGDIWVAPVDGGEPRRLTHDRAEAGSPAWTRDGREILYWSRRSGSQNLWAVPATGGEPRPVTSGAGEDAAPAVSPDGRTLVFTNTRNRYVLTLLDPSSGAERVLLERAMPFWVPAVSPDGTRIAFSQATEFGYDVFTVGIDGAGLHQVTRGEDTSNIQPRWSSDGSSLYYYQERPVYAYRRIAASGGVSELIAAGWSWKTESFAVPSPDESQIAFLKFDRTGGRTVIRDLRTDRDRALPGPPLVDLQWSPDGRFVLGQTFGPRGVPGPDSAINLCPARGGPCQTVTSGRSPISSRFSADGSSIYFLRPPNPDVSANALELSGAWVLWSVGTNGSDERRITEIGPFTSSPSVFDLTPDDQLVYSRFEPGRSELWIGRLDARR